MKAKILTFLSFMVLSVALTPLRMLHDFNAYELAGTICTFVLTAVLIKRTATKPSIVLGLAILGFLLIGLLVHIFHFYSTIGALYGEMVCMITIILGYFYTQIKTSRNRIIFLIISISFCIFASTWLAQFWIENVWEVYTLSML